MNESATIVIVPGGSAAGGFDAGAAAVGVIIGVVDGLGVGVLLFVGVGVDADAAGAAAPALAAVGVAPLAAAGDVFVVVTAGAFGAVTADAPFPPAPTTGLAPGCGEAD
jgi:hypothetical protein